MTIITKTANDMTVTADSAVKGEYLGEYITLSKAGNQVASGYEFISEDRWMAPYNPPAGTFGLLKSSRGKIQPVGKDTATLIQSAIDELSNLDEIKLPRERNEIRMAISVAYDKFDYMREQDYNEDIGFHKSAPVELEIATAEQALKDFDAAHPELAAEIAKKEAEKTARQIQSALNA